MTSGSIGWTSRPAHRSAESRDALDSWSTALAIDVAGEIPGVADDPPTGWTELVDGRGVFLRRAESRGADPVTDTAQPGRPDAWYVHGLAGSSSNWTSLTGALSGRATGYLVD